MVRLFTGGWADGRSFDVGDIVGKTILAKVVTPTYETEYYRYDGERFVFDDSVEGEWIANGWK